MKLYNSLNLNNLPLISPATYSSDEINELFDLSEEESVELTKVINDSHVAINKVYSNSKTEERLAEILIEANQFATEQLGKSNFLSIDIVTSTDEVLDDTVIYLIDDGSGSNTYNQYVLIGGNVTSLGSTQCDLTNYVTNDQLETKLEDYAKKNEVISASDVVTTLDDTVTDAQIPSALATYNATKDMNMKTYTTVEQLGLSFPCTVGDIYLAMDSNSVAYICVEALASSVTDVPYSYGLLTISKRVAGRFTILYSLSAGGSVAKNRIWIGQLKGTDGTGLVWEEVLTSDNGYGTTNQTVIDGTTTDVTTLPPGHYVITTGCSTSMNLPFNDTTNYAGVLFIIGRLNSPTSNKGYRVMLYFDNKSRSAINHEWWGTYMGWKVIATGNNVMQTYNLTTLGITSKNIGDIATALPNNSMCITQCTPDLLSQNSDYLSDAINSTAFQYGELIVTRVNSDYIHAVIYSVSGYIYYIQGNLASLTNNTAKFYMIKGYKMSDVAKKSVELADKTKFTSGSVAYMVRDGICYVSISGLTIGTLSTTGNNNIVTGLPVSAIYTLTSGKLASNVNVNTYTYPFNIVIEDNGSTVYLKSANTNATGVKLYASFSYPVAE